jgi:AraC-like DNA-binding protein/mannose-6-phosphate isomerase-like protein (cupin superfamily)
MNECGDCSGIHMMTAEDMFKKNIPFKIYRLNNEHVNTSVHSHNYIQIWYVMSGYCEHHVNGSFHHLARGNLFVLPPFVAHKIKAIDGVSIEIVGCEFSEDFINENMPSGNIRTSLFDFAYLEPFLVSSDIIRPRLHLTGKSQIEIEQMLEEMLDEYIKEKKYYEITIKADLLKILAITAREYENNEDTSNREIFDRYRDAVNKAISYIDSHFTESLHIKDVCKIAMMSQTYFSHVFGYITGKTFVEYINDLRLRKASDLLRTSVDSITDICYKAGYNNSAYFTRVFKKNMGLSPREYRTLSKENGR